MNELQQAYKTMGLPEHASKDEVEKRYTILMRQERSRQKQQDAARSAEAPGTETDRVQTGTPDFETVTRAYRFILEYEDKVAAEQFNAQEYGKYKNMAGTAQKSRPLLALLQIPCAGRRCSHCIDYLRRFTVHRPSRRASPAGKSPSSGSIGDVYRRVLYEFRR